MSDEKKIGYGRPPEATRFQKGKSGNPAGRPKRPPSVAADMAEVLAAPTKHGRRSITVQRALILKVVEDALTGDDAKDRLATLRFVAQFGREDNQDDPRAAEDAWFLAELQKQGAEPEDSSNA